MHNINSKILAVIPARKNSKRLPGKNYRHFNQLPLIHYTLRFAQLQSKISKIIVSTDDEHIKQIADTLGIESIDRPTEIAGDYASTASVIQQVLHELEKRNETFDIVATLQVTNPLRPQNLFTEVLNLYEQNPQATSAISVSRNSDKLGTLENNQFIPYNYKPGQRSQDLTPLFYENGLLYISNAKNVLEKQELFGENVMAYKCDSSIPLIDIDALIDFELGEIYFQKYKHYFSYLI